MLGTPPWIVKSETCEIDMGFGQFNASPHLEKHNVQEGSIFLFFVVFNQHQIEK